MDVGKEVDQDKGDREECHLGGEGAGGVGLDAAHHAQVVQTQEPAPGEREVHPSNQQLAPLPSSGATTELQ